MQRSFQDAAGAADHPHSEKQVGKKSKHFLLTDPIRFRVKRACLLVHINLRPPMAGIWARNTLQIGRSAA